MKQQKSIAVLLFAWSYYKIKIISGMTTKLAKKMVYTRKCVSFARLHSEGTR